MFGGALKRDAASSAARFGRSDVAEKLFGLAVQGAGGLGPSRGEHDLAQLDRLHLSRCLPVQPKVRPQPAQFPDCGVPVRPERRVSLIRCGGRGQDLISERRGLNLDEDEPQLAHNVTKLFPISLDGGGGGLLSVAEEGQNPAGAPGPGEVQD